MFGRDVYMNRRVHNRDCTVGLQGKWFVYNGDLVTEQRYFTATCDFDKSDRKAD